MVGIVRVGELGLRAKRPDLQGCRLIRMREGDAEPTPTSRIRLAHAFLHGFLFDRHTSEAVRQSLSAAHTWTLGHSSFGGPRPPLFSTYTSQAQQTKRPFMRGTKPVYAATDADGVGDFRLMAR